MRLVSMSVTAVRSVSSSRMVMGDFVMMSSTIVPMPFLARRLRTTVSSASVTLLCSRFMAERKSASVSTPARRSLTSSTGTPLTFFCTMRVAAAVRALPACTVTTSFVITSRTFISRAWRACGVVSRSLPTKFMCEGSSGTLGSRPLSSRFQYTHWKASLPTWFM